MPDFGALLYTSCRPGEGLRGASGLQFRAVSEDTEPAAMDLVERSCLYEPPRAWMGTRPGSEFPRSLAHVFDGRYATGSGIYLDSVGEGGRAGNHFTHALVTDDPASYGQVRPAQLWGSTVWRTGWEGPIRCPREPGPPRPGPFDPLTLHTWICGRPDGEAWLRTVVSALDAVRAGGPRVLFRSADPAAVLAWVAAATILIPRAEALRIAFKVYSANPDYTTHDVVAVHPDWASALRESSAFCVFDLDAGVRPTVPDSAAAAFWVPRFVHGDCFDVLDAVELSGSMRPDGSEAPTGSTERLVAATLVLGEPIDPADGPGIVDWLTTMPDLGERRLAALAAALLDGPLDAASLDVLVDVVGDAPDRRSLAMQVFARALAETSGVAVPVPATADRAGQEIERVIDASGPETVRQLLTFCARHDITPRPGRITRGLHGFVRWWADRAVGLPELGSWPCREEILDMLRDELRHRLRIDPAQAPTLGELWWEHLIPSVREPRDPLDAAILRSALRRADGEERLRIRTWALSALGGARDGLACAWTVLHGDAAPELHELPALFGLAHDGPLPEPAATAIEGVIAASPPDASTLHVLDQLVATGHRLRSPTLLGWHAQTREVAVVADDVAALPDDGQPVVPGALGAIIARLGAVPHDVLEGRAEVLVAALGGAPPDATRALVAAVPAAHRAVLLRGFIEAIGAGRATDRLAAASFRLLADLPEQTDGLRRTLAEHRRQLTSADNHRVAALLPDDDRAGWWSLGDEPPGRRLARNPFRRRPR